MLYQLNVRKVQKCGNICDTSGLVGYRQQPINIVGKCVGGGWGGVQGFSE